MESSVEAASNRGRIVVFSGPPASGKSYLAGRLRESLRAAGKDAIVLSMDQERKKILPHSDQSAADRAVAYRSVHRRAYTALTQCPGMTVILDATYGPQNHRESVAALADKSKAEIFLVEVRVAPDDAVDRLRSRGVGHGAVDLTDASVRSSASSFPFYGGGLRLDTSKNGLPQCERAILHYINRCRPLWSARDWAKAAAPPPTVSQSDDAGLKSAERKISPRSRIEARFILGIHVVFLGGAASAGLAGVLLLLLGKDSGGTAWLTLSVLLVAGLGVFEFASRPVFNSAQRILSAAADRRYGPVQEVRRSNREVYWDYRARMAKGPLSIAALNKHLPIDGVPIYFLVRPGLGHRFDVRVNVLNSDEARTDKDNRLKQLENEAAAMGFDWHSYESWRRREKSKDYYGFDIDAGMLRSTFVPTDHSGDLLEIKGERGTYFDYLVAEQSVTIEVPRQLPYMREFFEGRKNWENRCVSLDGAGESGSLYSRMVNVNVLITTMDRFIVLQRRSGFVQAATGGVASSAAGRVDWSDVSGPRAWIWKHSLRAAVYREIREELGLYKSELVPDDKPFVAAAYNLQYGRDLNFYAHLKCRHPKDYVANRFAERKTVIDWTASAKKDQWEVAHLIFVSVDKLGLDGLPVPEFDRLLGDSRHVRGALFALRASGRL